MREKGLSSKGAAFYSHLLPSLETAAWKKNRVSGEGWLAVGDAAGLVDPITGEGLYYAIRSADLAAKALLSEIGSLTEKLQAYRVSDRHEQGRQSPVQESLPMLSRRREEFYNTRSRRVAVEV